MRAWAVLAIFLTLSLAGCAASEGPEGEAATDDVPAEPADSVPAGNQTDVNETFENLPPNATFEVLNVTFTTVVFSIQVTDPEDDLLNWTLDAKGNGTTNAWGDASTNVTFDYLEAGNYTAVLRVTDGQAVVNVTLALTTVAQPAALPGQHATGSWTAGLAVVGCFGDIFGVGYPANLNGIAYRSFAIEAHTIGYDYAVSVTGAYSDSPGFAFLKADRSVIASDFMSAMATGTVPEAAAIGVWWTCAGAQFTGTFDSTPA